MELRRVVFGFCGKVAVDAWANRLVVSDSGHHRLLEMDLGGNVRQVIGSVEAGKADGSFTQARFNIALGVAMSGDLLYVADTENHLIRRVDLATQQVETIAGTGEQYGMVRTPVQGPARSIALNSPWDIVCNGDNLYIAMAGSHRIFVLHLESGIIEPFAGAGPEALRDGSYEEALFAQPNSLALDDSRVLYVADSETSAVRAIALTGEKQVTTLAETRLFAFRHPNAIGEKPPFHHLH